MRGNREPPTEVLRRALRFSYVTTVRGRKRPIFYLKEPAVCAQLELTLRVKLNTYAGGIFRVQMCEEQTISFSMLQPAGQSPPVIRAFRKRMSQSIIRSGSHAYTLCRPTQARILPLRPDSRASTWSKTVIMGEVTG